MQRSTSHHLLLLPVILLLACSARLPLLAQTPNILYDFSGNFKTGQYPNGSLVQAPNGNLYGVTNNGSGNYGTLYQLTTSGAIKTIHSFAAGSSDGAYPNGRLYVDSSGNLYGTCYNGGASNVGIVYKLDPSSDTLTILHSFAGGSSDGANALDSPILGSDGKFYGTTLYGGTHNAGIVWTMNTDGTNYQVRYNFGASGDGANPVGSVIQSSSDHRLYGTCYNGGGSGNGTLYSLNTDGSGYDLYSFTGSGSGTTGKNPAGRLVEASPGVFFGAAYQGGSAGWGDLFKFTHSGSGYTVSAVFYFDGITGAYPYTELTKGKDGNLYGTASLGGAYYYGSAYKLNPGTGAVTLLHSFNGIDADFGDYIGVGYPSSLMQGKDGSFYSASFYGGVRFLPSSYHGDGAAFKMTTTGTVTPLASFNNQDIYNPEAAGVIQANDGYFYGITYNGGAFGDGAIYKTDAAGNLSILHYLNNYSPYYEGAHPNVSLIQGKDGALYGTTDNGGVYGDGTLFRCDLKGNFSVLHQFQAQEGVVYPNILLQGSDGNFYGTAVEGGFNNWGTVYKVTSTGALTVLHYFNASSPEGYQPEPLSQDSSGNLWGTTYVGGANNAGTLWKMNTSGGSFTVVHTFIPGTEGANPFGGVLQGQDGNLYGTCWAGGSHSAGTVYQINPTNGALTVIHTFAGGSNDGANPSYHSLVQGPDGSLYGNTYNGGVNNLGTFFKVSPVSPYPFTLIHSFVMAEGQNPYAPTILGSDGDFYSTARYGGASNVGTLFFFDTGLANAADVSASISATYTVSGTTATITVKNTGKVTLLGPIQAVLVNLPAGVTCTNASGTVPAGYSVSGDPYLTASGGAHNILALAPGKTIKLTARFSAAPGTSWSVKTYTGRF